MVYSEVCGMKEWLCFARAGRTTTLQMLKDVPNEAAQERPFFPSLLLFYKGVMAYSAILFFSPDYNR